MFHGYSSIVLPRALFVVVFLRLFTPTSKNVKLWACLKDDLVSFFGQAALGYGSLGSGTREVPLLSLSGCFLWGGGLIDLMKRNQAISTAILEDLWKHFTFVFSLLS